MKSTITDVAKAAGLSTATVDRVLNNRPGVSAANRHRVYDAARRLGYLPTIDSIPLPSKPAHLEFIIPVGDNLFLEDVARHVEDFAARLPLVASCTMHRLETYSLDETLEAVDRMSIRASGLAILAVDHPRTRDLLRSVAEAGVRVVTLASDVPVAQRAAYVGIDNRAGGRTAAWIMGKMIPGGEGEVAVFVGSRSYRGHEEREAGFRSVLAEDFPGLKIASVVEVAENCARSRAEAQAILDRNKEIAGLYCIGAGQSGIVEALRDTRLRRKPLFVCHDLTAHMRSHLLDGMADVVIDQNARLVAEQSTIQLLGSLVSNTPFLTCTHIEPRVILRENIPAL
jgi:LacI family transcriptional regulator